MIVFVIMHMVVLLVFKIYLAESKNAQRQERTTDGKKKAKKISKKLITLSFVLAQGSKNL